MNFVADRIVRYRWIIIFVFIATTVFFARQIPKTQIESDMKTQLPQHWESRLNTDKIDEIFGGTEMMMVLFKTDDVLDPDTLKRVKKISKQMKRVKGVDKVLSLFELKYIRSEDGAMIVDPELPARLLPRAVSLRKLRMPSYAVSRSRCVRHSVKQCRQVPSEPIFIVSSSAFITCDAHRRNGCVTQLWRLNRQ